MYCATCLEWGFEILGIRMF